MSVWVLCIHYGLVLSWLYFQKPQIGYNGHPLSIKMNETEDNYQSRPPTHLVCKVPPVRDQGVIPELLSIGSDMECLRSLGLYLQTRNCRPLYLSKLTNVQLARLLKRLLNTDRKIT